MYKIFFSFLILQVFNFTEACEINSQKQIVSFSSSISYIIQNLNLYDDPKIKYILKYHLNEPLLGNKINQEKLFEGGQFIAQKDFKKLNDTILFYDESSIYDNLVKSNLRIQGEKIFTRGKSALELSYSTLGLFKKYLNNCEKQISKIKDKLNKVKSALSFKDKKEGSKNLIFFLGELKSKQGQDMIMGNDGFVIDLKNRFNLYQTNIPYLYSSEKELKQIEANYCYLGLADKFLGKINQKNKNLLFIKKINPSNLKNSFNIYYPGILLPGFNQIDFLEEFLNLIDTKKFECFLT